MNAHALKKGGRRQENEGGQKRATFHLKCTYLLTFIYYYNGNHVFFVLILKDYCQFIPFHSRPIEVVYIVL
jgi:hypothetical protein